MDKEFESVARSASPQDGFLPDFCQGEGLLAVVVMSELLALLIAVVNSGLQQFDWVFFAKVSMMALWISLLSALLLCKLRPWLSQQDVTRAATLGFMAILLVALLCGAFAEAVLWWSSPESVESAFNFWRPVEFLIIAAIPAGIMLRYLFLQQQLRVRQRAELEARIQALQSRIRPHFLFNSMNMVASLIGSDPEKAERVIEDLCDLFRHALTDTHVLVPLRDELSLCRRYLALEKLRLGDRLTTTWQIGDYGEGVMIPCLTLQPVVENAVYHGIQLLQEGGEISVEVKRRGDQIEIVVTNPLHRVQQQNKGNKMAMHNIRERLHAHFGGSARVTAETTENCYITRIKYSVAR
ncbi:MAG: histidine kinase [Pseudomonadales bacterium]|nr:histidine kinase [Pseudomonadales bacterium]MCP5170975.1 histidine kinase [Pseudomonadales bacterium]MCP5301787.1 histidine kinase [Pseudomonadales bacterium]